MHRPHAREDLRSQFVFGPGFTQVLLLVCILMLGIVVGMKVSDYFHGRDMEASELALYRASQASAPKAAPAPQAAPANLPEFSAVPTVAVPTQSLASAAAVLPPPPRPVAATPATSAPAAGATQDYSDQLALLQQERDLMRQRFDNLNNPTPQPATPEPTFERPSPIDESGLPAPKGQRTASSPTSTLTSPSTPPAPAEARKEHSAAEQRIRDAPSLGKVLEYDADWHFVVINCGSKHNLEPDRKLAIRRDGSILGLIRIDEILPDQSVAELDGAWKGDPKAIKPQPGDDVLTYPPF